MFPGIKEAIQTRRATYYFLNNQHSLVDNLVEKGLIDEKEGHVLLKKIDKRLKDMKVQVPAFNKGKNLDSTKISEYSADNVFSPEELETLNHYS